MKKKHKNKVITITSMRENGFIDGYSGSKSKDAFWLETFTKRKMNLIQINEYIEAYRIGYKVGKCSSENLDGLNFKNGELYYNDKNLYSAKNIEQTKEEVKRLTFKKKGRRK